MSLRLLGEAVDAVKGLDIRGWLRKVEASDADPALTVQQNAAGSVAQRLIAGAASVIPLAIKGAPGQSSSLLEILKSTDVVLIRVTPNGSLYVQDAAGNLLVAFNTDSGSPGEQLYVQPFQAATRGLSILGKAAQTADLQTWEDSTRAVLARVLPTGELASTVALRTKHEGAATPTGGASGDIRIGNGKIWVNDAGTWKSVAVA